MSHELTMLEIDEILSSAFPSLDYLDGGEDVPEVILMDDDLPPKARDLDRRLRRLWASYVS